MDRASRRRIEVLSADAAIAAITSLLTPLLKEGCQPNVVLCAMNSLVRCVFPLDRNRALSFVLAALAAAAPAGATQDAPGLVAAASDRSGQHDFDFLFGEWQVHHHVFKAALNAWIDFEGTSGTRQVMGGAGNVEGNVLHAPTGTYRAAALRAYDPSTGQWAIWWLDGRAPNGPLDPPVKGSFADGEGRFYSDDTLNGQPSRTRYLWSHITATSARWEQAFSTEGGKMWETNWTMDFTRVKRPPVPRPPTFLLRGC